MESNSVQPGLMFTSDPGINPLRPVGRPSNPSNPSNPSDIFLQTSRPTQSFNPIVTTQSPSVFNPVQSPPISNPISVFNSVQSPPVFNPSNPSGPFPFAVSSTGLYLFIYILCFSWCFGVCLFVSNKRQNG